MNLKLYVWVWVFSWQMLSNCFAADLPRSTPELQGVSSAAIYEFVERANTQVDSLNSFMMLRHGQVIAEAWWTPYNPQSRHSLYSLSKSFTSTAVGLAAAEGKLSVDDEVLKFFPDQSAATVPNNLKLMRVSDLLRMNTGHQTEPPRPLDQSWVKAFLEHHVPFKPGTHFMYNTSATYMQSAIVQKATGKNVLEFLRPRLFEPLGIENPTWEMSPEGIATGGYGLSIRTEDIAKFGQLYLQQGNWNGKQLVPAAWIQTATARQTSNGSNPKSDWDQGYGYQFWRCRHGAYRGDGAFGQYCIVMPEQDTVIAITSGLKDMQSVLNLVWDHLLPNMHKEPLTENKTEHAKLVSYLQTLKLRPQTGTATASITTQKVYRFADNEAKLESLQLQATTLIAKVAGKEYRLSCPKNTWEKSVFAWSRNAEQPAAGSGAWTEDDTFTAKICFYETPFVVTVRLKFTEQDVECTSETNVGFGSTKETTLLGKAE
jgi:Beta-lactamase